MKSETQIQASAPSAAAESRLAHIDKLCSDHNITADVRSSTSGRSWRKTRRIRISAVKSEITCAAALHEIGHILGPSPSRRLDREAAAWTWAQENALEWTPRMQAKMQDCLDSYARWFLRKRRRGIKVGASSTFDLLRGEALTMAIP